MQTFTRDIALYYIKPLLTIYFITLLRREWRKTRALGQEFEFDLLKRIILKELVDRVPRMLLETLVTLVRDERTSLMRWTSSFISIRKMFEAPEITLPMSLWYDYYSE